MRTILTFPILFALAVLISSCSNDEEFNSGWQASLESDITLSTDEPGDISLGSIDLEETAMDYLDETQGDYKSFNILEVTPAFGSLTTTNIVPLDFLDELDIYVVADGTETLIGMTINTDPNAATRGIDFLDVNLEDLADDEDRIEIVLRPTYEGGVNAIGVASEIELTFNFTVEGVK